MNRFIQRSDGHRLARRLAVFACSCLIFVSCAHPKYGNLFDTTASSGIAILAALLGDGAGTGARIGYSWERTLNPELGFDFNAAAVVYQDVLWILGGANLRGNPSRESHFSSDGVSFSKLPSGTVPHFAEVYGQPAALAFNGAIYYATHTIEANGDSRLRIYSTTDAQNFTQRHVYLDATANTVGEPSLAVYNGRLFVYDFGQVFYSDDGVAWTNGGSTGIPEDAGVTANGTAVFNGRLVREYRNRLYVSDDGISFALAIAGDSRSIFYDHLVFDGRLFSIIESPSGAVGMFETSDLISRTTISPLNTICCRIGPYTRGRDYAPIVFRDRMRFYKGRESDTLAGSDIYFSLGGGVGRDGGTHTDFSK
ncbi:MAG: hypothetical protein NXI24_08135 [bacterium]|nr:hypothetical protein [bacterium]